MNTNESKGSWEEQKRILKQRFASLTNNDLLYSADKKKEMLKRIQIKLSLTNEEIDKIISDL